MNIDPVNNFFDAIQAQIQIKPNNQMQPQKVNEMTPDDIKNWEKKIIATERIVEFENLCRNYQGLDLVCPICSNLLIDP